MCSETICTKWYDSSWTENFTTTTEHSKPSLSTLYALDHKRLLKIRSANIEKWRKYYQWKQDYNEEDIDRRQNLSLEEFSDIYDGKWPVIITDVVQRWPAYNWTGEFFNEHYGKEQVLMKTVDVIIHYVWALMAVLSFNFYKYFLHIVKPVMTEAVIVSVPVYKFHRNIEKAHRNSWSYVEDELFIPMRPELRKDIGNNVKPSYLVDLITKYVKEDFFEIFPEDVRPWNAMLLWGTKYSRSSLHMDPYNWTATSTVIRGRKRWKLYPPGQDEYLYIMKDKRSGFPLDCYKYNSVVDAFDPDMETYPMFDKAASIMFEQLPGEILFIPSGWFHQAYNDEETLAISSQLMNKNNYRVILEEIIKMDNIQRDKLPTNIDMMSPQRQVETVMSMLPKEILERGRIVTDDVLYRMKLKSLEQNEYL
ncbi:hypothetical protein LSH36_601g00011 [Paralvinella palmiformis]|uniref:JmjC domain-containing protein n=1 Tax=Paralvinella palmiformis TaxID=53620 RepID=A0AAD9J612_9ANNE|nr:hypothetical protein LSH36_601g00011 [Paralvinella palmiformis]